jgi:hypothetical protein
MDYLISEMPARKLKQRDGSVHAEDGRFEFKGHALREPASDASGGNESELLDSAGLPVEAQNVSGNVSAVDSASNSPGDSFLSSAKTNRTSSRTPSVTSGSRSLHRSVAKGFGLKHLLARRGRPAPSSRRQLLQEFAESGDGLLASAQEPGEAEGQADDHVSEMDALDDAVRLLDLSTKSCREATLRYLSNDHVIRMMNESEKRVNRREGGFL